MTSKTMSKASLIVPCKADFSQSFEPDPPPIQNNVPFKCFLNENLSEPDVSLDKEVVSTTDSLISLRLTKNPNEEQEKKMTEHCSAGSSKVSDDSSSLPKTSECAKISEQAENADSGKSSMCRDSICSNISDESSTSGSVSKPHKGNDSRWEAIRSIRAKNGDFDLDHFKLLKKVGSGDIGRVYLSELIGTKSYFALKVMDKEALATRKKLTRAQMELDILQCLDHPFLPTLYSHFEMEKFSCLVMEFCPGGDLHMLRQRQPGKHFSESAAKFYVAEVLLALEYLHMLGIIYRDLKPENILVREDGHIMLSDFDLSLRCSFSPTLISSSSYPQQTATATTYCMESNCIQPSCSVSTSCFSPRLFRSKSKSKSKKNPKPPREPTNQVIPLPELIVEPTDARSMSFVGTHEYLAPEIIRGHGHGSAVDWWTLGIFLYELLFGKTPFKGSSNQVTLSNVIEQPLRFPESPSVSYAAKDLIRGLLMKDPKGRLGVKRGAAEIKQHLFFEGVNWALIRCTSPPEVPRSISVERLMLAPSGSKGNDECSSSKGNDESGSKGNDEIDFF